MALLEYDQRLLDDVAARFDLRAPNKAGLREAVYRISGQEHGPEPIVLDMATGAGKTYLLAALLDYAAAQGVRNMLVVLPGRTVRAKTIANFTPGADGWIEGAEHEKTVVTIDDFEAHAAAIHDPNRTKLYLANVHTLEPDFTVDPHGLGTAAKATYRGARLSEQLGGRLLEHLAQADDLLMVLDESHSYSETAKAWSAALDRLAPAARIGLTATPKPGDRVVYRYSLAEAIRDEHVKTPVVAMRRNGYRNDAEREQLLDAKRLLERKAAHYRAYEEAHPDATPINPIMLVACRDTAHADEVAAVLRGPKYFGAEEAVLVIHSDAMTAEAERALAEVQRPESPVRAIVQVQMLTEGWNAHNVAVLVPLRALESATFTEQLIGRGLRLPYHAYTGDEMVDTLDVLSHESVRAAMRKHGIGGRREVPADEERRDEPGTAGSADTTGREAEPVDEVPAVDDGDAAPPAGTETAPPGPQGAGGEFALDPGASDGGPDTLDVVAGLGGGGRDIDTAVDGDGGAAAEAVWVQLDKPGTIDFPSVRLQKDNSRYPLSSVDGSVLDRIATATRGTDYRDGLEREIVVLAEDGSVRFRGAERELVELDAIPISVQEAVDTVALLVRKQLGGLFNGPDGRENIAQLPGLLHRVVDRLGGEWNAQRAAHLGRVVVRELRALADTHARNRPTTTVISRTPVPKRQSVLVLSEEIREWREARDDRALFDRHRYYKGWRRDRFTASRFDAYTTEFRLAILLDTSDDIVSWMRLEPEDRASIEFLPGRTYFPDFVAVDTDGVHWIIEGKAEHGRDDVDVRHKRDVARAAVRTMEADPQWQGTRWGYLIAYETDVSGATTWASLRSAADSEVMRDRG